MYAIRSYYECGYHYIRFYSIGFYFVGIEISYSIYATKIEYVTFAFKTRSYLKGLNFNAIIRIVINKSIVYCVENRKHIAGTPNSPFIVYE